MFIQVIQGKVTDPDALRSAFDRWLDDLAPGAVGWLGFTGGVTDNGDAIALVRFDSAESAGRNSDRREQHQWWTETAKLFSGEVTFHDCDDVDTFLNAGSDDAGFVQVIQGKIRDTDRWLELTKRAESEMSEVRPEIIGGTAALHGDGGFTEAVYFTSEEEAREGERKEPPTDIQALLDEERELYEGDLVYYDLRDPWLASPRR